MENASKQNHSYSNGEIMAQENNATHPYLFENTIIDGLRSYQTHNGVRIFKPQLHLERLKACCEKLMIPFDWNIPKLIKDTYQLLQINKHKNAFIQMAVKMPISNHYSDTVAPNFEIKTWEWEIPKINNHQRVSFSEIAPHIRLTEGKTLQNLHHHYQLQKRATLEGFDECILFDENNQLLQGLNGHLFIEKDGVLYTPKNAAIFAGVSKEIIKNICKKLEIEVVEKQLHKEDLCKADSAFLCGTTIEIAGIKHVNESKLPMDWHESLGSNLHIAYKNLVLEKENYEVII